MNSSATEDSPRQHHVLSELTVLEYTTPIQQWSRGHRAWLLLELGQFDVYDASASEDEVDSRPFKGTPEVLLLALNCLTWTAKYAVPAAEFLKPNELLTLFQCQSVTDRMRGCERLSNIRHARLIGWALSFDVLDTAIDI